MVLGVTKCTAPFGQCTVSLAQLVINNAIGGACVLPVLGIAPSSISFGNVAVGSSSNQTVTLTRNPNSWYHDFPGHRFWCRVQH